MEQKPSVGRIVHLSEGGECRAAIVVSVHPNSNDVSLTAFSPSGASVGVPHAVYADPEQRIEWGTWHWPERV